MFLFTLSVVECHGETGSFEVNDTTVTTSSFSNCGLANEFIFSAHIVSISASTLNANAGWVASKLDFSDAQCTIGNGAFGNMVRFCEIIIGPNVKSIGSGAFFNYGTNTFIVNGNTNIIYKDGMLIDHGQKIVIWSSRSADRFTVPAGIERLGSMSFHGTKGVLTLPSSITAVSSGLYSKSGSVIIEYGSTYHASPDGLLLYLSKTLVWCSASFVGHVTMENVTEIGNYAFMACSQVTGIDFPDSLRVINVASFIKSKITSLTIPKGVNTIRNQAFEGTNLENLYIKGRQTIVSSAAFKSGTLQHLHIDCFDNPDRYISLWSIEPEVYATLCSNRFTAVHKHRNVAVYYLFLSIQ